MSAAFWLDSSDDSLFFAPSSNISSRSSAVSLDINDIPLDIYPSLLLPSRSLNALPLWDHEPAKPPPCPSTSPRQNRRRTQNTFLSLVASLALPKGNRPSRKYANVLVSSPTPGRLRNVPQLKPALKTWISAIPSSSPPDMAPWSPPRENPHYVWVPEGSCFPPLYLRRCLRERHSPPGTAIQSTFDDSCLLSASGYSKNSKSPPRSRSIRRRASNSAYPTCTIGATPTHTTATVPSVPVRTKPRRWSISVPPSHLSTEFLHRQLEFRRLNATIGIDSAQSDAWNEAPQPPLPSIKVSTSTATIAVSVPGSPESPTPNPEPLAIRRGKKMLTPLTLHTSKRTHEEYPDIPTAFLGTPSAYSPHYQFSSLNARPDTESLAVGDMINALRSQVAGLKPSFLAEDRAPLSDKPPPPTNSLCVESSDIVPSISEDDWAFAHELMSRYSDLTQSKTPSKEKRSRRQATSTRKSLTPETSSLDVIQSSRARRASVPLAVSTPKNRPKSSSAPRTDLMKLENSSTTAGQGKALRPTTLNVGNRRHVPRPVSSPGLSSGLRSPASSSLDTLPGSSRSESSAKRPLGILKHAKSVRFADMPKKGDAEYTTPSVGQPRAGTSKENGTLSSLQPSPLRAYFVPAELNIPTPSKQSQATPVSEEVTRISTASRRSSVQPPSIQTATSRTPAFGTPTSPVVPVASDKVKLSNSQLAAKTFSLLAREHDKDRENIPLALRTHRRMRRYTQADENVARRASGGEGGGRKHRLSSPLKSFLERLRA
ncbi:hypothetical protein H4582DRAFT_2097236 [Lactarius indigo]|nr:hypothetical protein H4582DRAFT_2097236 [Lactarius indigo]